MMNYPHNLVAQTPDNSMTNYKKGKAIFRLDRRHPACVGNKSQARMPAVQSQKRANLSIRPSLLKAECCRLIAALRLFRCRLWCRQASCRLIRGGRSRQSFLHRRFIRGCWSHVAAVSICRRCRLRCRQSCRRVIYRRLVNIRVIRGVIRGASAAGTQSNGRSRTNCKQYRSSHCDLFPQKLCCYTGKSPATREPNRPLRPLSVELRLSRRPTRFSMQDAEYYICIVLQGKSHKKGRTFAHPFH
jgi:hypothetical protein